MSYRSTIKKNGKQKSNMGGHLIVMVIQKLIWGNFFMMGVVSSAYIWRTVRDKSLVALLW